MTRSFVLRPATVQEIDYIRGRNAESWAGGLTVEDYHKREKVLFSQPLTRNGGISSWVLVDPTADAPQPILSSCESIKKPAFVVYPGEDEPTEIVAHGIGSVFTPAEQRGNGYASIMLQQLGETLQQDDENGLSVLYSDIGKKFYAKLGWQPHRSSHLEMPVVSGEGELDVKFLHATDVAALCARDIADLREKMSKPHHTTRIAFQPDYRVFEWHGAREEFLAEHLRKLSDKPEIKGAITADGKRWMVWRRDFSLGSTQMDILRLVNLSTGTDQEEDERELAKLFQAAAHEAAKWGLDKVCLWNPDERTLHAAGRCAGKERVTLTEREIDSICSLKMHGHESSQEDVEWLANEKFSWC